MTAAHVDVVVMVGEVATGDDPQAWVQGARRAAAQDLLTTLQRIEQIKRIFLVTPDPTGLITGRGDARIQQILTEPGNIHVGHTLARLVEAWQIERLFYLGGASAPLMSLEAVRAVVSCLGDAEELVYTNNRFASDWAAVTPASCVVRLADQLPRDNMLGWVLSTEGGLPCESMAPSAASRLDIDTPPDLMVLRLHAQTAPALRSYLQASERDMTSWQQAIQILRTPATRVFLAGRIGPQVWQRLNETTQCWIRVLAEERGMISSGRQERGDVYSLLATWLDHVGVGTFFAGMSAWADLAIIDTRVLMAHHHIWPPAADRFASDLDMPQLIADPWLRSFTDAAGAASVPVLLGGHSLLAGDMLAIADLLQA